MQAGLMPEEEFTTPYLVEITFVPAVSVTDISGSSDDPIVTIKDNSGHYAFPLLTNGMYEIYSNIFANFPDWHLDYSPEEVRVIVGLTDLNDVDKLRDEADFDVTEGEGWGNLTFDDVMYLYYNPEDLEEGGDLLYIPLINSYKLFTRNTKGDWVAIV